MEVKPALALPDGLELITVEKMDKILTTTVASTQESPCCPCCGQPATRIRSRYSRQAADLPCGGQHLHLVLHVRKFFCEETICTRKIFVERLTPFLEPWSRVTLRLFQGLHDICAQAVVARLGHEAVRPFGQTVLQWSSMPRQFLLGYVHDQEASVGVEAENL